MKAQTDRHAVTAELKKFWQELGGKLSFELKDWNKLNDLFSKLWATIDSRMHELEMSRENWKTKYKQMKNKIHKVNQSGTKNE